MPPPEGPEGDRPAPRSGERIAKLLARAGIASRREVERMIAEGRVALNGTKLETAATILPSLAGVTVDGNPVAAAEPARLFAFHKPSGLITAERDPAGRPTIYAALRNALAPGTPRLMPVGRLDFTTEGLLLLTNDGGLKRALELPATGVPRTYRARAFGNVTQARLDELIEGITIDGVRYGKIEADLERGSGLNRWIQLTLTEGKNREVRRVLEHLGLQVSRLIRVGYGPFALGDLPRGAATEVPPREVAKLAEEVGVEIAVAASPIATRQPRPARTAERARPPRSGGAVAERAKPAAAKPDNRPWGARRKKPGPAKPSRPLRPKAK